LDRLTGIVTVVLVCYWHHSKNLCLLTYLLTYLQVQRWIKMIYTIYIWWCLKYHYPQHLQSNELLHTDAWRHSTSHKCSVWVVNEKERKCRGARIEVPRVWVWGGYAPPHKLLSCPSPETFIIFCLAMMHSGAFWALVLMLVWDV